MGERQPEAQVKGFAGFNFIALICSRLSATLRSVVVMEKMFLICLEDKEVIFTDSAPHPQKDIAVIEGGGAFPMAKVQQIVENNKRLYILSSRPEEEFRTFCAQFRPIHAAGGVVSDAEGNILMIFRNGRWDLPKGHCEAGETMSETALREVEEECGITGLTHGKWMTETRHTYLLHGAWVLKIGQWFRISHPAVRPPLRPQTEEGILRAEWISREQLPSLLAHAYTSIRRVFEHDDSDMLGDNFANAAGWGKVK